MDLIYKSIAGNIATIINELHSTSVVVPKSIIKSIMVSNTHATKSAYVDIFLSKPEYDNLDDYLEWRTSPNTIAEPSTSIKDYYIIKNAVIEVGSSVSFDETDMSFYSAATQTLSIKLIDADSTVDLLIKKEAL